MEWSVAIPVASVGISVITLIFTAATLKQKTISDEFKRMQERLVVVDQLLEECKKDRDELRMTIMELKQDIILRRDRPKSE
jgi:hypothetical protein